MSKYKVGDKVKLTGTGWGETEEGFNVGQIVVVDRISKYSDHAYCDDWNLEERGKWGTELYTPAEDNLNPSHYASYKDIEVIQLTEQLSFNRGNVIKYVARAGLKNPETEIEDLKKSLWYLNREIERLEKDA